MTDNGQPPERIFLQWYCNDEFCDDENCLNPEPTYCVDRIEDNDVEYVRLDKFNIPYTIYPKVEPKTALEVAMDKITNPNSKPIHLEHRHAAALVAEIKRLETLSGDYYSKYLDKLTAQDNEIARLKKALLDLGVANDGLARSSFRALNEVENER